MSINFDALKKKLSALNEQTTRQEGSGGKKLFWKPKATHIVRILPNIHKEGEPFHELYFHYNISDRPHLSPISYNEADPIAEFSKQLQNTGDREDYKMGKRIEPRRRVHVAVLVRGEEHEGVKFWGFSDTVYKELLGIILDPDYGDITDLKNGRDITVTFTPGSDNTYSKTTIRPKPNTTMATENADVAALIKEMPRIEDIYPSPSYDDLKALLYEYLKPGDEDPSEQAAQQPEAPSTSENKTAPTTVQSAVDAFDQLFK